MTADDSRPTGALTDDEIDAMLTDGRRGLVPAGLPGGPAEDTVVSLTPAEIVAASRLLLSASRAGVPLADDPLDNARRIGNARRIIRRARLLGLA